MGIACFYSLHSFAMVFAPMNTLNLCTQTQVQKAEVKLEAQEELLIKAVAMEAHCKKLQQQIDVRTFEKSCDGFAITNAIKLPEFDYIA